MTNRTTLCALVITQIPWDNMVSDYPCSDLAFFASCPCEKHALPQSKDDKETLGFWKRDPVAVRINGSFVWASVTYKVLREPTDWHPTAWCWTVDGVERGGRNFGFDPPQHLLVQSTEGTSFFAYFGLTHRAKEARQVTRIYYTYTLQMTTTTVPFQKLSLSWSFP